MFGKPCWRERQCVWLCWLCGSLGCLIVLTAMPQPVVAQSVQPCEIRVIDRENGWPVPLVQLKTTHEVVLVTDNDGVIALDLPEVMGIETWFSVQGHGYSVPADGFGMRGVRLTPTPGGKLEIKVDRQLPAKRLGRITGGGQFGESQKLGRFADWKESGRWGCDSVQTVVHEGKLFWGWGDTNVPGYPLGLFQMTGATTGLRPVPNWEPPIQLRYDLLRDEKGKLRNAADVPGPGPTWLDGFASVPDSEGRDRMVATYAKIQAPMETYQQGLCVWDAQKETFFTHKVLWDKEKDGGDLPDALHGHVVRWTDGDDRSWLLFGDPFPKWKVPVSFQAWEDPQQWIALQPQETVKTIEGKSIKPHRGSIAYNAYRDRWVCVFCQIDGQTSMLGELWYCESDSPLGPWENAIHVVTHDHYTFYNPHLHPELVDEDSPVLLFEATYTKTFSSTATSTPRYEYNQVLYRLDLDQMDLLPNTGPQDTGRPSSSGEKR